MTNEEAMEALTSRNVISCDSDPVCEVGFPVHLDDFEEAIGMAISALRAQEKEPCEFCGFMDDFPEDRKLYPKEGYTFYSGYYKQIDVDVFDEREVDRLRFCPMCGRPLN